MATLSAELSAALASHPSKAAYDACIAARAQCASLEADVINFAIFRTNAVPRIATDELDLQPLIDQHGASPVGAALAEIVASSKQPLDRIAALMIERHHGALGGSGQYAPLADAAYADLDGRPIPEANLLAERHRRSPPPAAAADEFARLAWSGDRRTRRAAFVALGHPSSASQLHQLIQGLAPDSEHWFDAAMAAAVCGMRCAESMLSMIAASSQARTALYEAIAFSPDDERQQLVEMLLRHAPTEVDGTERALREEFLSNALSERR